MKYFFKEPSDWINILVKNIMIKYEQKWNSSMTVM